MEKINSKRVASQMEMTPFNYYSCPNQSKKPRIAPVPPTMFDQCKRIGKTAIPFIGIGYKPLSKPVSLVKDGVKLVFSISSLVESGKAGDRGEIVVGILKTASTIASIAGTVFKHPLISPVKDGFSITLSSISLVQALNKEDYKKAAQEIMNLVAPVLCLGALFSGVAQLSIAASSIKILISVYKSSEDFRKEKYLESGAGVLMSAIKTNQLIVKTFG